jgi:hypothetical protein
MLAAKSMFPGHGSGIAVGEEQFNKHGMRVWEIMDLDIAKVMGAWTLGVGNWMLGIDTVLHITVSCLSIIYISLKILEWYKRKDK